MEQSSGDSQCKLPKLLSGLPDNQVTEFGQEKSLSLYPSTASIHTEFGKTQVLEGIRTAFIAFVCLLGMHICFHMQAYLDLRRAAAVFIALKCFVPLTDKHNACYEKKIHLMGLIIYRPSLIIHNLQ